MRARLTEYTDICVVCGRRREAGHHMLFGTGMRELADVDNLLMPMCDDCHDMGERIKRIHGNPMAERLSKIMGQLLYEKEFILEQMPENEQERIRAKARESFRNRYGKSYL